MTIQSTLYVEKNEYPIDENNGVQEAFYRDLSVYIKEKLIESVTKDPDNIKIIENFINENKELPDYIKNKIIRISSVWFPALCDDTYNNFCSILSGLGNIYFDQCHFITSSLDLKQPKVFFDECQFHDNWYFFDYLPMDGAYEDGYIYRNCTFYKSVLSNITKGSRTLYRSHQFNQCNFKGKIHIYDSEFSNKLFDGKRLDFEYSKIPLIKIENSKFNNSFLLNDYQFNEVVLYNNEFDIFEFMGNSVDNNYIKYCSFNKSADFSQTDFIKSSIDLTKFKDLVSFERCKFGNKETSKCSYLSKFNYVIFYDFANFRGAIFNSGIDISSSEIEKSINFIGVEFGSNCTNRESYRIIKNLFDLSGNKLEGNKIFSREMLEYKNELKHLKWYNQEKLVFNLNDYISGFGRSYLKPIFLIFFLSIIYGIISYTHDQDYLYKIYPPLNEYVLVVTDYFNSIAKNIFPFKDSLKKGMEFIGLVYNICLSILIWQVIISAKRFTKR